jgi:hypothetical protein
MAPTYELAANCIIINRQEIHVTGAWLAVLSLHPRSRAGTDDVAAARAPWRAFPICRSRAPTRLPSQLATHLKIEFDLGVATTAAYMVKKTDQDSFDDWS